MRLSEKTLELSIIAQLTERLAIPNALWLGLTQKEEKNWGFDAASELGGTLYILQFKASNTVMGLRSIFAGQRRFKMPHAQLERLQVLAGSFPGAVSYALPHIGNTAELASNQNLVDQTWLLDVAQLPHPYPPPTSAIHYAFIAPPECEIRSVPVQAKLRPLVNLTRTPAPEDNARTLAALLREPEFSPKGLRLYGLLIPPGS